MRIGKQTINKNSAKPIKYKSPKEFDSKNLNYTFYEEYQETGIYLKQECIPLLEEKNSAEVQTQMGKDLNNTFLNAANSKESVKEILSYGKGMSSFFKEMQAQQFSATVCYPGLLIGTGYPHKTKQVRGEIQMGTLFDWTTGAPYYPGSSVKGVLKHLFKIASGDGIEAEECRKELSERIRAVCPSFKQIQTKEYSKYLKDIIFENAGQNRTRPNIFYDAYLVGFRRNAFGQQKKILGMDSLAPHEDILKDPIPINMLRILPDVCLTFSMRLNDVKDPDGDTILTSDQLFDLFKNIILDLGIGAKTHTGYGGLKEINESDILYGDKHTKGDRTKTDETTEKVNKGSESFEKDPADVLICPKCGSKIIEDENGQIRCINKCGMLYGNVDGEKVSLDQIKLLLIGEEIITPSGKVLFVDPDDSYEEFTTKKGAVKFRLKIRKG